MYNAVNLQDAQKFQTVTWKWNAVHIKAEPFKKRKQKTGVDWKKKYASGFMCK